MGAEELGNFLSGILQVDTLIAYSLAVLIGSVWAGILFFAGRG